MAVPAACRFRQAISSRRTTPRRWSRSTRSRRSMSPSPFPNRSSALYAPAVSATCRCPHLHRRQYIYVVTSGDGIQMRPVTIVQQVDNQAVIGKGVNPGETVVTDGQIRLTPKSKVDVKKSL